MGLSRSGTLPVALGCFHRSTQAGTQCQGVFGLLRLGSRFLVHGLSPRVPSTHTALPRGPSGFTTCASGLWAHPISWLGN